MSWADSYQEDLGETDQYGRRKVSAETQEQVRKIGVKFRRNVRFEELGSGENGYFDRSTADTVAWCGSCWIWCARPWDS